MSKLSKVLCLSVARKFVMGLSGLALVGFIISHLIGNLGLYTSNPDYLNGYTAGLHSWGPILIVAELGLAAVFLVHIVSGISLALNNRAARPEGYQAYKTKGGPSKSNLSSRTMIVTGLIILVFLVLHVWKFRFGPGIAEGYTTTLNGKTERDLYRLVRETFREPVWVAWYVGVMLLLGFHLRHGFWSAFQSLGANSPGLSKPIYVLGVLTAVVLAAGFFFIPIYCFMTAQS